MSASFVADTWLDLAGETVGRGPDMAPHAQADDALIEAARHLRLASEYLQGAGAVLGFDGVRGPRA